MQLEMGSGTTLELEYPRWVLVLAKEICIAEHFKST